MFNFISKIENISNALTLARFPNMGHDGQVKAQAYLRKGRIGQFFSRLFNHKISGIVATYVKGQIIDEVSDFQAQLLSLSEENIDSVNKTIPDLKASINGKLRHVKNYLGSRFQITSINKDEVIAGYGEIEARLKSLQAKSQPTVTSRAGHVFSQNQKPAGPVYVVPSIPQSVNLLLTSPKKQPKQTGAMNGLKHSNAVEPQEIRPAVANKSIPQQVFSLPTSFGLSSQQSFPASQTPRSSAVNPTEQGVYRVRRRIPASLRKKADQQRIVCSEAVTFAQTLLKPYQTKQQGSVACPVR